MKFKALVSYACGLCCGLAIGTPSEAVDASRVTSQSRSAPNWGNSAPGTFNDPAIGYGSAPPSISRDRAQSTWVDPLQPAFDSRMTRPLDPNFSSAPYGQSAPQRWRLGIFPEDTDTGVVVKEVVRNSAAERAGLEVNDRVLAVHGYQVGYVDGALFDVGQEFEKHADASGWVRVLVQDNRNGRVMNVPVKLDGRSEAITGTITYRDRAALPRDAVATVELREIVRNDLRPITLTQQTIPGIRQVPIPFSLEYDPTQIDTRRSYVLHASIESQGREIYGMTRDVAILDGRTTSNVQLLVEAPSYPSGTPIPNRQEQIAQITQWFRQYLGRDPRAQELYVWEAHLERGGTLADAQLQILSTPEFYYQSNADDTQYVRRMFLLVTGRQPSQQEVSQWLSRLDHYNRLRPEVAREFLASAATAQARQPGRL